jgi:tRNA A37 methylthiotransferase MiaB
MIEKKLFSFSNGCPESRIDLARMQQYFFQNGWTEAEAVGDAALVLFNSCAGTQDGEDASIGIIGQMKKRMAPSARLIVAGCLPKINLSRLRTVYDGPTFGSDEIDALERLFPSGVRTADLRANRLARRAQYVGWASWFRETLGRRGPSAGILRLLESVYNRLNPGTNAYDPGVFCIKVSTGCLGNCAYCGVRLARGTIVSKPIEAVVEEFDTGLAAGSREFTLIGTDLGCYGRDHGHDLVALLREMVNRPGEWSVRLRNVKPNYLRTMLPGLEEIFATGRVSFLSSAVEAGSDRIVALMNRPYSVEEFEGTMRRVHERFPKIITRTQIVVGFPSETEAEFRASLDLVRRLRLDFVESYMFQSRPLTAAAALKNQIPESVKRRRQARMQMHLIRLSFGHSRRAGRGK